MRHRGGVGRTGRFVLKPLFPVLRGSSSRAMDACHHSEPCWTEGWIGCLAWNRFHTFSLPRWGSRCGRVFSSSAHYDLANPQANTRGLGSVLLDSPWLRYVSFPAISRLRDSLGSNPFSVLHSWFNVSNLSISVPMLNSFAILDICLAVSVT